MKPLTSLGISDFKKLREKNCYYVDKSLLIRDIETSGESLLLARPRRFGKTLNMSMVRYFYDIDADDNAHLFEGLAISQEAACMAKQGKHPVIFLSFKDVKNPGWKEMYPHLVSLIQKEANRFLYLLESDELIENEKKKLAALQDGSASSLGYSESLLLLSNLLARHHQSKTVIIIDEYDSPIHVAWLNGFFTEAIAFFRDLLGGALKDNTDLEKGLLTGILRVAKESIFSGLNNFSVSTVLDVHKYQDKFGFTTSEVRQILVDYDLNGKEWLDIEEWYDGYRFGEEIIFNPWSILNYVDNPANGTKPYWVNTSDNAILKRLFFGDRANIQPNLEALLRGEKITVVVNDNVSFQELDTSKDTVWSLLLSAGYLKQENRYLSPGGDQFTWDLSIPNREVRSVYKDIIVRWLQSELKNEEHDQMLEYLTRGELKPFEKTLRRFVEQVFSYHDVRRGLAENFYHAFFLGLFAKLERTHVILSNRETGYGRYDICMIPRQVAGKKGIVIELKTPDPEDGETLETAIAEAEQQMQKKKYDAQLAAHGVTDVFRLAIAVLGKQFLVKQV